jgi:hypothetical protein
MISVAMVQLAQTVHLSCTDTNTVSKRIETCFHLSLITQEYHPVHPKQFLSLLYIQCKPCTYHAPKLTLCPKGSKWDSTWPTSPRSSIGCIQIGFWGYGMFGVNCIQTYRNELLFEPRHLGVPSGVSKMISEPMVRLAQTMHLSCTETNTISKRIKMRFYMTHVT